MLNCSYCSSTNSTDMLLCCMTLSCNACTASHPCPAPDLIALDSKHPVLKICKRCNVNTITHKCAQCKMFYCKSCKQQIHKGKYQIHDIVQIDKMQKGNECICGKHSMKRNILLENGSIGCVRCADQCGLRRLGVVEESNIKVSSVQFMKKMLSQKRVSLQFLKSQINSKWNSIQNSASNIFNKLLFQVQERKQNTFERIRNIRDQQLITSNKLIQLLSVQVNSLQGMTKITHINKDKFLKLKLLLVDENIKIIQRKKKLNQYNVGKLQYQSLVSAIRGLVSIEKVKDDASVDRKRGDIFQSNKKQSRRSHSKDLSTSRVSQVQLHQSGMKTRQNSMSRLNIPITQSINFEKKLAESIVVVPPQKGRLKSEIIKSSEQEGRDTKKLDPMGDKFKTNFLQMKENIRRSGTYFNQRPTTRR